MSDEANALDSIITPRGAVHTEDLIENLKVALETQDPTTIARVFAVFVSGYMDLEAEILRLKGDPDVFTEWQDRIDAARDNID
jgi:hypothetical protein